MKNKIIILCGESSSGKDSILNILIKEYGWHKAVSYTTRPMRQGEKDGYDYHFLMSNIRFNELMDTGHMFEKTEYKTNMGLWLYGLGEDSFVDDNINVCIVNPHGLDQLLEIESLKDRLVVFYITAPFKQRFFRYLKRDADNEKHKIELVDRFIRDEDDFKGFAIKYNTLSYSNKDGCDIESFLILMRAVIKGGVI
jgi:guanylate kinase